MIDPLAHWNPIYERRDSSQLGWFQPHLRTSLQLIASANLSASSPIIDIGAGDSTLIDDLLLQGYEDLTALDISPTALKRSRARIGPRADRVRWLEADILQAELPRRHYALWHDRALFHFFVNEAQRSMYLAKLTTSLAPSGTAIIATFAPDGPTECSGLPTHRYGPQDLLDLLGQGFELEAHVYVTHTMPSGTRQQYSYAVLKAIE